MDLLKLHSLHLHLLKLLNSLPTTTEIALSNLVDPLVILVVEEGQCRLFLSEKI